MDIVVSNIPEGGVDGGELEGAALIIEVTIQLLGEGFISDHDAVVC